MDCFKALTNDEAKELVGETVSLGVLSVVDNLGRGHCYLSARLKALRTDCRGVYMAVFDLPGGGDGSVMDCELAVEQLERLPPVRSRELLVYRPPRTK